MRREPWRRGSLVHGRLAPVLQRRGQTFRDERRAQQRDVDTDVADASLVDQSRRLKSHDDAER